MQLLVANLIHYDTERLLHLVHNILFSYNQMKLAIRKQGM